MGKLWSDLGPIKTSRPPPSHGASTACMMRWLKRPFLIAWKMFMQNKEQKRLNYLDIKTYSSPMSLSSTLRTSSLFQFSFKSNRNSPETLKVHIFYRKVVSLFSSSYTLFKMIIVHILDLLIWFIFFKLHWLCIICTIRKIVFSSELFI